MFPSLALDPGSLRPVPRTNQPVGYLGPAVPRQGLRSLLPGVLEPTQVSGYPEMQLLAAGMSESLRGGTPPDQGEARHGCAQAQNVAREHPQSRAQWKAEATGLVNVSVGGRQHKVPRRLLKAARLGLIDLDKR